MTAEEIVKLVCAYFNSIEDKIQEDYERDVNDPNWSSTDAYCYTLERSPQYATVEVNGGDATIKYREYTVFIRDMPNVLIQHIKVTFDEEIIRTERRSEVDNKIACVKTVYHGENATDFNKLSADDIVPFVQKAEKEKKVVEIQIVEENWYRYQK